MLRTVHHDTSHSSLLWLSDLGYKDRYKYGTVLVLALVSIQVTETPANGLDFHTFTSKFPDPSFSGLQVHDLYLYPLNETHMARADRQC